LTDASERDSHGKLVPTIIRYASKITLRTFIQTQQTGKIYPPILQIQYSERLTVRRYLVGYQA
jgi:hypothetical protein